MSPFIFFHIFSCLSNNILLPSPIINTIMIIMFMVQWIFHWMNSTNYWVIILFEVTIIIIVHYVFEKSFNYKYVLIILFHYIHVFPIVFLCYSFSISIFLFLFHILFLYSILFILFFSVLIFKVQCLYYYFFDMFVVSCLSLLLLLLKCGDLFHFQFWIFYEFTYVIVTVIMNESIWFKKVVYSLLFFRKNCFVACTKDFSNQNRLWTDIFQFILICSKPLFIIPSYCVVHC